TSGSNSLPNAPLRFMSSFRCKIGGEVWIIAEMFPFQVFQTFLESWILLKTEKAANQPKVTLFAGVSIW
ncbi:MAG: hypothetical protein ACE5OR_07465, partial [bacterium]